MHQHNGIQPQHLPSSAASTIGQPKRLILSRLNDRMLHSNGAGGAGDEGNNEYSEFRDTYFGPTDELTSSSTEVNELGVAPYQYFNDGYQQPQQQQHNAGEISKLPRARRTTFDGRAGALQQPNNRQSFLPVIAHGPSIGNGHQRRASEGFYTHSAGSLGTPSSRVGAVNQPAPPQPWMPQPQQLQQQNMIDRLNSPGKLRSFFNELKRRPSQKAIDASTIPQLYREMMAEDRQQRSVSSGASANVTTKTLTLPHSAGNYPQNTLSAGGTIRKGVSDTMAAPSRYPPQPPQQEDAGFANEYNNNNNDNNNNYSDNYMQPPQSQYQSNPQQAAPQRRQSFQPQQQQQQQQQQLPRRNSMGGGYNGGPSNNPPRQEEYTDQEYQQQPQYRHPQRKPSMLGNSATIRRADNDIVVDEHQRRQPQQSNANRREPMQRQHQDYADEPVSDKRRNEHPQQQQQNSTQSKQTEPSQDQPDPPDQQKDQEQQNKQEQQKDQEQQNKQEPKKRSKTPEGMRRCQFCDRTFNPDRLEKHTNTCQLNPDRPKRKVYDGRSMRTGGTEFEKFIKKSEQGNPGGQQSQAAGSKRDWRKDHEQLVNAIQSARGD